MQARALCLCALSIACAPLMGGCSYIEQARRTSDIAVEVGQHYRLEALVQADIERRRLRAARCHSPLLTPSALGAAAIDERLGERWVDELLRDCPGFGSFLSDLTLRRARQSGVILPAPPEAPVDAPRDALSVPTASDF